MADNDAAALQDLISKTLARRSLIDFSLRMMPNFVDAPHTRKIADSIQTALDGNEAARLLVVAPPQHGKSTLASQLAPAFDIGRNPDLRIVLVSYSASLAERNGRIVRELIRSPEWPFDDVRLSDESQAVDHFSIAGHRGYIRSVGAGGSLTGFSADRIVLDDLVANYAAATSEVEKTKLVDWLLTVVLTRLSKSGKIIAIGTRWSETDILSTLINLGGFQVLHLPALSLGEDIDPLRRPLGTALWPAHKNEADLAQIRADMGELKFSTIFQGIPLPDAGIVFNRSWLEHDYDKLPANAPVAFSIDPAGGVTANSDPSVLAILATDGVNYFIEDIIRRNVPYFTLKKLVVEAADKFAPLRIWIESSSNGIALIDDLKQTTLLPVVPVKVSRSKVDRARAVAGLFESGKVKIRQNAPWFGDLLAEFLAFPSGRHDDIVDAVVQGLAVLRESTAPSRLTVSFMSLAQLNSPSPSAFKAFNGAGKLNVPGVNVFAPARAPRLRSTQ